MTSKLAVNSCAVNLKKVKGHKVDKFYLGPVRMKCTIPEISWHNRDPVLSVDIQPKLASDKNEFYRLASGGTDSHVLIWYMSINDSGSINLDVAADLTRHQRAVNAVKWAPSGELLASGDDESVIFIWKQKEESEVLNIVETTNEQDKEIWLAFKILRGHMEDVYDLSWSPNSLFIASGSVDNTAIIWDVLKGKSTAILNDHKGFVQGVAWDPQNKYVATLSTDRYMRVFDIQTKKTLHRVSKCTLPVPPENNLYEKSIRLFHDDTLQTFFRRLCFSPDGKLLIAPAGVADFDGVIKPINLTYIFSRYTMKQPAIILPSPDQYTVAVVCCPLLFKLRPHTPANPPAIPLPYRMLFAIATKTSVYLYDTQQTMPFGLISNIHYTRLTDLAWSNDGRILVVSSTDGFCSLITFADGELGEIYSKTNDAEEKEGEKVEKTNQQITSSTQVEEKIEVSTENDKPQANKKLRTTSTDARLESTPADIIVDRKIISSDERFESPEKKDRPVTPILIRRQPRSQSVSATQSPIANCIEGEIEKQTGTPTTPSNPSKPKTPSSKSSKKTPSVIPIRRQPRNLIPNPVEKAIIVEEAIDAWPLGESPTKHLPDSKNNTDEKKEVSKSASKIKTGSSEVLSPTIIEHTQDLRLVYEESQDDGILADDERGSNGDVNVDEKKDSECKTPRRVPLKTISTPKSKKKLINDKDES